MAGTMSGPAPAAPHGTMAGSTVASMAAAVRRIEPPAIDDRLSARLNSLRQSFRRRLSDQVEAVFQEACQSGDLATAADLLSTLERMQARADAAETGGRRRPSIPLEALRAMLAEHRADAPPT